MVEVGKLADFVILSADPTAVDPETLDQIKVVETIKEGRSVYVATKTTENTQKGNMSGSCAESEKCFANATANLGSMGIVHVHFHNHKN